MPKWKNIPNDPLTKSAYQVIENTNDPTLEEIINLLDRANRMPSIVQNRGNSYSFGKNQVSVSPSTLTINSFAHELTHALNHAYSKAQQEDYKSKDPFFDAYGKLIKPEVERFRGNKPMTPWEEYRYSLEEAPAWAVGNVANQDNLKVPSAPPNHLDSTLATEQAILRDLFSRYLRGKGK